MEDHQNSQSPKNRKLPIESERSTLEKTLNASNDEAIAKAISDLLKKDESEFYN